MRGYCEYDDDEYQLFHLYDHVREVSIHGCPGQKALRELEAALLAMPVKELGFAGIVDDEGRACAVGVLAMARGKKYEELPSYEQELSETAQWAKENIGLTWTLAAEISNENDGGLFSTLGGENETPTQRYTRVLAWVRFNLAEGNQ